MNQPSSLSYAVAVRTLCEFTAKVGDLDIRFTPGPSAQEGNAAHTQIAARRGPKFQRELTLSGSHAGLTVRGRADGYDPALNRLEEFKSHRGDLTGMRANHRALHWAQLKIYAALWCRQKQLTSLTLGLVYFDIQSEREKILEEEHTALELNMFFEDHCARFVVWARAEVAHRARRDCRLQALPFPHAALRSGQRQLAEGVYRAALGGASLMAQAPTGIGKTIGTLFPLLKAAPVAPLDRVLFLVAKGSGRRLGLDALRLLSDANAPRDLRVLELVAKESACEYPGRACNAASCPLASGFYDRLPAARVAALALGFLDQSTLRGVAQQFTVCPYYLTQELSRWSDVIVCDYNYYFDSSAVLHALAVQDQWRVGILIDEAHNLVARARAMYSATLTQAALDAAVAASPPSIKAVLHALARGWRQISAGDGDGYAAYAELPVVLTAPLQRALTAITDYLAIDPTVLNADLLRFYFDGLQFSRLADSFGAHALFDATAAPDLPVLCIRNIIPAPFLAQRFAAATTTVLFSATLAPTDYYVKLLGLPSATQWLDVESPFAADQLTVCIESRISTRYRDRAASLVPIANLIGRQYAADPGNYLAFFSSYDYLQAALRTFQERFPEVPVWRQSRRMVPLERDAFLARFTDTSRGVGFAVLGGLFAEGIDLPGARLIGAFIATLGLPQINQVNAAVEARMQSLFGAGYEYTYLYPGLQKVVQAAGRVIRTPLDRGTLFLIDDRFRQTSVRDLLPDWWRVECV